MSETTDLAPSNAPICSPSSTPRTDALMVPTLDTRVDAIMAFQTVTEHAKTLERELADARRDRDEWKASAEQYQRANQSLDEDRSKFLRAIKAVVEQSHGSMARARKIVREYFPENETSPSVDATE